MTQTLTSVLQLDPVNMVHDVKILKAITFVGVKLASMERTVERTSMIALQVQ